MIDYGFGNYIASLRNAAGLSQYQLGMLLGVSDKAVSKWENGASKPRMKTCMKMASILGIGLDELMGTEQTPHIGSDDEEKLWEKAKLAFHTRFGEKPPVSFTDRFESEKTIFYGRGIIQLLDMVSKIRHAVTEDGGCFSPRTPILGTLLAWLLDASEINPLRPHTRCPKCGTIKLYREVKVGWDLPETRCGCGEMLIRDGHDIPFARAAEFTLSDRYHMVIEIVPSRMDLVRTILNAKKPSGMKVQECILNIDHPEKTPSLRRFLMLPSSDMQFGEPGADGLLHFSDEQFFNTKKPIIAFTFILFQWNDICITDQTFYANANHIAKTFELFRKTQESSESYKGLRKQISDALISEKESFSLLRQILALSFIDELWAKAGRELYESGSIKISELPACQEDVYESVLACLEPGETAVGFPGSVMRDVRFGFFFRNSKKIAKLVEQLREIGFPEWKLNCIQNSPHMWDRYAVTVALLRIMREANMECHE